jgi:hypothetical protein
MPKKPKKKKQAPKEPEPALNPQQELFCRYYTMPIHGARWYVEPASEDQADQDIADFVSQCLFEHQSITWNDLLRQALLSLPFGVMVFEKVFTTMDIDGTTRIVWDKLAPRMPKSIQRWAIGDGKQPGILQYKSDGSVVEIPMEKLVVIVNEMEGENWWGTSILRAAYKHWFIKNTFYKIDAIAFERQGLGIPSGTLPENRSLVIFHYSKLVFHCGKLVLPCQS